MSAIIAVETNTGSPAVTRAAPFPYTLTTPAGSLAQMLLTFSTVSAATGQSIPYAIPAAWAYTTNLFEVTSVPNTYGALVILTAFEQVQVTLYPAATATLAGTYPHTLWSDPGTASQYAWLTGSLIVTPNAQP